MVPMPAIKKLNLSDIIFYFFIQRSVKLFFKLIISIGHYKVKSFDTTLFYLQNRKP